MKTRLIALGLFALTATGLAELTAGTNQPGGAIQIDPRAQQMQMAVLKDQSIPEVADLLAQGVDINAPIGCGTFRPVDGAVANENLPMLRFLLAHGAKLAGRELPRAAFINDPKTALDFVKVLLAEGIDPNATDPPMGSALGCATYRENHDVVILLLARPHINVNVPDQSGQTALMYAAKNGSVDLVNLLLKAGADPSLKDARGATAMTLAGQGIAARQAIISKLQSKPAPMAVQSPK